MAPSSWPAPVTRVVAAAAGMMVVMFEAGMRFRWRWPGAEEGAAERLALEAAMAASPLLATLLWRRGIRGADAGQRFLQPRLSQLHDPATLPGVDAAAQRIAVAVRARQPIVIYGDYDVDGITASAILWHVLRLAGADVSCYVPHRVDEGYGLNVEAIRQLAADSDGRGKPLIVSVDCGITAVEPAQAARDAGVDLIITDHHEFPPGALPSAAVLVHPRLPGSAYPFGMLCGAGVAFKLAWQVAKVLSGSERVPQAFRELLLDLLSLAALGTVADVVPLVDENRIITLFGLGQIKRTRFAGLNALIDASKLRGETIDAFHVGFVLGPRLNACGRMGHAREAVHLLTAAEPEEAAAIAAFLTQENDRRRTTERQMFEEAHQMVVDGGYDGADCRAIVLGKEGWHPGVIGIVASRLVDRFARPVVMINLDAEEAHGSARSVDGLAINEAIGSCAPLLSSFGGHAMAAGLRMKPANLAAFRDGFLQYVNAALTPDDLVHTLCVDAPCTLEDLSVELVRQTQRLAPFGRGNPAPILCLRDVRLESPPQRVGQTGRHLRLLLRQGQRLMHAIGFGLGELADDLAVGVTLDMLVEPKLSTWQGRQRAELHVKDFKRA